MRLSLVQMELYGMLRRGELQQLWDVARETELHMNAVRGTCPYLKCVA